MVVEFAFANHFLHNNFYNLSHADADNFLLLEIYHTAFALFLKILESLLTSMSF